MITEVAEIAIKPGTFDQLLAGVEASKDLFARSPGFHNLELHHVVENPDVVILLIKWDSVADHMEKFRKSPEFALWRANVGHYFSDKPRMHHTETKLSY